MQRHAATRLIVFPVVGRRWAFSAKPPVLPGAESAHPTSVRELFGVLRTVPKILDRAEILTEYFANQMHTQWTKLGSNAEGTLYKRIHNGGFSLLSNLRPSEGVLKNVHRKATAIEIVYPSSLNATLVRRRVRHLAKSGLERHRPFYYGSVILLPFTSLLGILPVPNLPFFWNIFRAYSHWTAFKGGERLLSLTHVPPSPFQNPPSQTSSPPQTRAENDEGASAARESAAMMSEGDLNVGDDDVSVGESCGGEGEGATLILSPSEDLESLLSESGGGIAVDDETLAAICEAYEIEFMDVKRWRDMQKL